MDIDALVSEISLITGRDPDTLRPLVWKEALQCGSVVRDEALAFQLNFHQYDARMEEFYRQSEGFLIETMVESCRPAKAGVVAAVIERIRLYRQRNSGETRILLLGDGSASDSIALWKAFAGGVDLHYFDLPGSKTALYASRRLSHHSVKATVWNNYADIPTESFDVLICLEVLEHLPDPCRAIADMASFLKRDGICLVTESFSGVGPCFPTHLASNLRYRGETAFLFLARGLLFTRPNLDPPARGRLFEFRKVPFVTWRDRWSVERAFSRRTSSVSPAAKMVLRACGWRAR